MRERTSFVDLKPKVLFVHHGGELYGSDKVFAETIRHASAIVEPEVVLSGGGPLVELLRGFSSAIHVKRLGVLRRKNLSILGVATTFWHVLWGVIFLCRLIKRTGTRVVYTNTVSVFSSPIAARLMRVRHIWHVHEIITSPSLFSRSISWLVPRMSDLIVFNSFSTKQFMLRGESAFEAKTRVVHNGIDLKSFSVRGSREEMRNGMDVHGSTVFVGMIGRINYWKGQDDFLEAAALLRPVEPGLKFGIIGSVYGEDSDNLLLRLKQLAQANGLAEKVYFGSFDKDISKVYEALDIVVVPSKLPEPFGLVTIEAMAAEKPVIATAHGGSLEIVVDGITGYLVPANRPDLLAKKISTLARNASLRRKMGQAGRQRVACCFTQEKYREGIQKVILEASAKMREWGNGK